MTLSEILFDAAELIFLRIPSERESLTATTTCDAINHLSFITSNGFDRHEVREILAHWMKPKDKGAWYFESAESTVVEEQEHRVMALLFLSEVLKDEQSASKFKET